MFVEDLERILIEELGYDDTLEFKPSDKIMWVNGRKIPDISHAYLINNSPVAYFSRLSELDPDAIQQLHKNVWSQTKAPMLFVTLPNEIRVYNTYDHQTDENGKYNAEATLIRHLENLNEALARTAIKEQLVANDYERIYIETGAFWNTEEGKRYTDSGRADKRLVESMIEMREQLVKAGLTNHLAYTLLGRSIFIRYLEDRSILTDRKILEWTNGKANSYNVALSSRATTYQLFTRLTGQFNGDLFPIEDDETIINQSHLDIIAQFLSGSNLQTGQLSLFPFNFEYLPIELISKVYDTFIDKKKKEKSGAYYTPLSLVDFVLEETMDMDTIHPDMKILDPACGSGLFLVGAFRRLISAWPKKYNNRKPTPKELVQLLQNNIFGVDINGEAVRIAIFSLYLEILNHLTNAQINDNFKLPSIRESNFLSHDFFLGEVDQKFEKGSFDRIVGNLPWGRSTLTPASKKWLKKQGKVVGDGQIAPAFMLRMPTFCRESGQIAVLAPARATILVNLDTHKTFRDNFFQEYNVNAIVNFSVVRKELFDDAISPTIAVFYEPNKPNDKKIVYATPKPSALSKHLKAIVLASNEIKFLGKEQLHINPHLWKIAMWGTPRDDALIYRLTQFNVTLDEFAKQHGRTTYDEKVVQRGMQRGAGKNIEWKELRLIVDDPPPRPYKVDMSSTQKISEDDTFERPRTREIFRPPLVLIYRNSVTASFSDMDVAYLTEISGLLGKQGHEDHLKWLTCYLNSDVARYYHFLTSTSWAVERSRVIQSEYKSMPVPVMQNQETFRKVIDLYEAIVDLLPDHDAIFTKPDNENRQRELQDEINQIMYDVLNLHPVERQQIQDTLKYSLGFFKWIEGESITDNPLDSPTIPMLKRYAEIFADISTSMLKYRSKYLKATMFSNGAPLTVVAFDIMTGEKPDQFQVSIEESSDKLRNVLRDLDKLTPKQKTPSLYIQRHVRVYDGDRMYLIRPSERRFWTESQARADADNWIASLME